MRKLPIGTSVIWDMRIALTDTKWYASTALNCIYKEYKHGAVTKHSANRLHPLHTVEYLRQFKVCHGTYQADRCTGRSTALSLKYISEAIINPYKWVVIKDHFGTVDADRHLRKTMQRMASDLRLQHLTFRDTAVMFGPAEGDTKV